MSALARLQGQFQDHVLGKHSEIAASVREQFGLPATERLAIYHNAYRIRLREALDEAYDKTWTYVGDEMFADLTESYIAGYPSTFRNLRWFGDCFAGHVAQALPDYPFIAELAQLEWALGVAFDAPDAEPVTAQQLRECAPEEWDAFALHPAVQVLALEWNVGAIWQALHKEEEPPEAEAVPAAWLVWRANLQPHFRSMDALEMQALRLMGAGESFTDVCEQAAADGSDVTLPMAGYLQSWLANGLLVPAPGLKPQPL
ncbi:MAG: DNA-binding domain-containing protein [Pseudomonadota bacterium]